MHSEIQIDLIVVYLNELLISSVIILWTIHNIRREEAIAINCIIKERVQKHIQKGPLSKMKYINRESFNATAKSR